MQMNDMIIISTDDHIIEPPDLFRNNMPEKYKDRAPYVAKYSNGQERWIVDNMRLCNVAASAVAGRKNEDLGIEPGSYSQVRKGAYDVHARVDDMNANGILSSLNFTNILGFAGEKMLKMDDKDLALACVQTYNDWHCDQWAGAYPGRFIPVAILPLWDMSLCLKEIRRMAKKGVRVVSFLENPPGYGLPSIHNEGWDPLFSELVDHNMSMVIHIGTSGGQLTAPSMDSPMLVAGALVNLQIADLLADIVYSPIPQKFPSLRIALSEGCMGWLPFMKYRLDQTYLRYGKGNGHDLGKDLPSDIIDRQFLMCFFDDPVGLNMRHEIGLDIITVEVDYPHADSTWPETPELLWKSMKDFPDEDINKITHLNAMRFFDFDPFKSIAREDATVGALRAMAAHVDVTPKDYGGKAPQKAGKVVSTADLVRLMVHMDEDLGEQVGVV